MKEFAEQFYHSKAWLDCRADFISRRVRIDGGMCQRCHDAPGYIVHHTIELNAQNIHDADIALNIERLEYICHSCHNKEHNVFQSRRRVMFDNDGNVLPV